jgi:hypothetical protein
MRTKPFALSVILLVLVASSAWAEVDVDYDKEVDFSRYTSYSWEEGTPAPAAIEVLIHNTVDAELQGKGLEKVEEGGHLHVITHASVEETRTVEVDTFGYAGVRWRGWRRWGPTEVVVNVDELRVGMVIVDLIDAESGELVWRGVGRSTVDSDPGRTRKRIEKAARKMFRKLPIPTAP